jgi:hypothetical protein
MNAVARTRQLEISKFAHDQAQRYLAPTLQYRLGNLELYQLTEVVHGYTGRCNEAAARIGLEWMRERYLERGEQPPF